MRTLLIILSLPLMAQTRVTMEPQPLRITQRLLGSRDFGLWTVTVESEVASIPREAIIAASPVSELTLEMSRDIMQRAAKSSRLSLLGHGWDALSPLVGQGLTAYGYSGNAPVAQGTGLAIAGLSLIRNLLRGTAPDPAPYLDRLLPESVNCAAGQCGTWYVVTGLVPNVQRLQFEISDAARVLEKLRLARIKAYGEAW